MKNSPKLLPMAAGLLVLTSCLKNMNPTTYQKMPKIQTLEDFKKSYGKTVKLFGVLVKDQLKNKKVVVAENVFFIKLSGDMLILLPTKNATDMMLSNLQEMIGTEIFVVGQPAPPDFLPVYEGLKMPSFIPKGFITALNDEMLTQPQITDLETLNTYKGYMKGEDSFFAYLVGTMTQKIHSNEVYPLVITVLLQDKTPLGVTISEKSDIDIWGYQGGKVFIKGKIQTKAGQVSIMEAKISNYEKYMDHYSAQ